MCKLLKQESSINFKIYESKEKKNWMINYNLKKELQGMLVNTIETNTYICTITLDAMSDMTHQKYAKFFAVNKKHPIS